MSMAANMMIGSKEREDAARLLREHRTKHGLTQADIAKQYDCHLPSVWHLEKGLKSAPKWLVQRILQDLAPA